MRTSPHPALRFGLVMLGAVVLLSACGRKPIVADPRYPDLIANPAVLNFSACPTLDANNEPVADVFPDKQVFKLQNQGRATAVLSFKLSFDAQNQFKVVTDPLVDHVLSGSEAEIAVEFTPTHAGEATATLTIDDGDDSTEPITVALVGTGASLPSEPKIQISYELAGTGEMADCPESSNGQSSECLVSFPDTILNQSSTLDVKVKNLGCPALRITGLSLEPYTGLATPQFYLDEPSIPLSETSPLVLSVASSSEANLKLRFAPQDDGSADDQRYGLLKIISNAARSPSLLTLTGHASAPGVYVFPTFCDLSDAADTCGGSKTVTIGGNARVVFQIVNGGESDVTITSVALRAPARPDRFQVYAEAVKGRVIAPGEAIGLPVDYTDAPTYVSGVIEIAAESDGMPTTGAMIRLSAGGAPPSIEVTPSSLLDFSSQTSNPSTLSVQVCNGAGSGVLELPTPPQVTQSPIFFNISKPLTKTLFNPGECDSMDVTFTRPATGGIQTGMLEISSNDPDYPAYRLNLYSEAPLDPVPIAVLKGPAGQLNGFSLNLSTTEPPQITIDGSDSYDPPGTPATSPPSSYWFYLVRKPAGATGAMLTTFTNTTTSVSGIKLTDNKVLLHLDPVHTGLYRVTLVVEDSAGQKSSGADLDIIVNP